MFEDYDLKNPRGRSRTVDENKLILLSIRLLLMLYLEQAKANIISIHTISWHLIEKVVAENFFITQRYVNILRKSLFEDGELVVFGGKTGNIDSPTKENDDDDAFDDEEEAEDDTEDKINKQHLLTKHELLLLIDVIDIEHGKGETVTRNKMRMFLEDEHNIIVSNATIGRTMNRIGLSYKPIKKKSRNVGAYRKDLLRDYIIEFDKIVTMLEQPDCNFIHVFTDESYCLQNHSNKCSYVNDKSVINKSSSKGQRLIILHAITHKRPLCQKEAVNNHPIESCYFENGKDVPKFREHPLKKVTAECLWKSDTNTGDYHNNMNSEMFMHWVINKLVPTFEEENEGKKMILILDNAAYHHKREIGSLSSKTKSELKTECDKYKIKHIDIPININRLNLLATDPTIAAHVQGEDMIRIYLENDHLDVFERASARKPLVPNLVELRMAILNYLTIHNPEALVCKVEQFLTEKGHRILWTPPYSPDLQPIELFWAAGKNHVARNSRFGIKMREVIDLLREGWYGTLVDGNQQVNNELPKKRIKKGISCAKLFNHVIKEINKDFIKICDGLEGSIGALVIDPTHEANYAGLPIDMLIADLVNNRDDDAIIIDDNVNDDFFDSWSL